MKTEGLRVQTTIPTAPTTLYLAWLSSEQHSAMTGGTAKIDPTVGGKFSAWNGYITGKLVVLDLGRRIVMSWRTSDFPRDAIDSKVEVHFEALGGSTRLTVLHMEIPEGQGEKYRAGWNDKYFAPMRTYFSKYLPDPRKPPPPRRPMPPPEEEEEAPPPKKGKAAPPAKPSAKAVAASTSAAKKAASAPAAKKAPPPPPAKAKAKAGAKPPPKPAKPAPKAEPKKASKPAAKAPPKGASPKAASKSAKGSAKAKGKK